jgi:hypothetical protein
VEAINEPAYKLRLIELTRAQVRARAGGSAVRSASMKRIGITLAIVGGAVGIVVGLLSFVAAFFLGEGSILIASFASGAGGILGIAGGFLAKSRRRAGAVVVALGGALGVWLVWGVALLLAAALIAFARRHAPSQP